MDTNDIPELPAEQYSLCEAVADIAFIAGERGYYGGDSRADISNFVLWGQQFQQLHADTDWDEVDYIITVAEFTEEKIKERSYAPLYRDGRHASLDVRNLRVQIKEDEEGVAVDVYSKDDNYAQPIGSTRVLYTEGE